DRLGLSAAPRVAVRQGGALLEDVTDVSRERGAVRGRRFSYLSRVTETVEASSVPVGVSVKPNALAAPAEHAGAAGSVTVEDAAVAGHAGKRVGARSAAQGARLPLEEARVVVAGGRGLGSAERFDQLVEPLAELLGGAVGA